MPSGTVLTPTGSGTGSWRHNRVAGTGIEPVPGGYAYHYNFRCSRGFVVWTMPSPQKGVYRLVSTPSQARFPDLLSHRRDVFASQSAACFPIGMGAP